MTNEVVKINVSRFSGYEGWDKLEQWQEQFNQAEIVVLLARAADQAVRSQAYRQRSGEQIKALKALLKANPALLDVAQADVE